MPRQNRVTPWGEIIAVPARGQFMGNRGCIHGAGGNLTGRRWERKAWVTCLLAFKGRQRQVMAPGRYTELFFLDEATALAAGHRPCATCRRDDYSRFKQLWTEANAGCPGTGDASIKDIDNSLHRERFISGGRQDGWRPSLKDLPDGTFVVLDDPGTAWLVWGNELLEWSPDGYKSRMQRPEYQTVTVLTPRSITAVLAACYVPGVHPSAAAKTARKTIHSKTGRSTDVVPEAPNPQSNSLSSKLVESRQAATVQEPAQSLYKLKKTPAGKALYTYFAAILRVTRMDQGKVYPLKKFLGNFSGHLEAGRIVKVSGGYQLTPEGIDYFNDRYNPDNNQHIEPSEVEVMVRLIRRGGADWVPVG